MSNNFVQLQNKALELIKQGQQDQALTILNQLISINNQNYDNFNYKGVILFKQQNYMESLSCFDQAIEIDNFQTQAFFNKANVLYAIRKYNQAIDIYNKCIAKNNQDYLSFLNKGIALHKLKNYEETIHCFYKVIQIQPYDLIAYIKIGDTFREIQTQDNKIRIFNQNEALQMYNVAIQLNQKNALGILKKAMTYIELDQIKKSIEMIDRCKDHEVQNAEFYELIIVQLKNILLQGQFEQKQKQISRGWNQIGKTLFNLENYFEANKIYAKAFSISQNIYFLINQIQTLIKLEEIDDAIIILKKLEQIFYFNLLTEEGDILEQDENKFNNNNLSVVQQNLKNHQHIDEFLMTSLQLYRIWQAVQNENQEDLRIKLMNQTVNLFINLVQSIKEQNNILAFNSEIELEKQLGIVYPELQNIESLISVKVSQQQQPQEQIQMQRRMTKTSLYQQDIKVLNLKNEKDIIFIGVANKKGALFFEGYQTRIIVIKDQIQDEYNRTITKKIIQYYVPSTLEIKGEIELDVNCFCDIKGQKGFVLKSKNREYIFEQIDGETSRLEFQKVINEQIQNLMQQHTNK